MFLLNFITQSISNLLIEQFSTIAEDNDVHFALETSSPALKKLILYGKISYKTKCRIVLGVVLIDKSRRSGKRFITKKSCCIRFDFGYLIYPSFHLRVHQLTVFQPHSF